MSVFSWCFLGCLPGRTRPYPAVQSKQTASRRRVMPTSKPASLPKLSRRQSLQLAAASTTAALLAAKDAASPVQAKDLPAGPAHDTVRGALAGVHGAKTPVGT